MPCLSVTSNVFFSVVESCFFHEKFPFFHFRSLEKPITRTLEYQLGSRAAYIIKRCDSSAVATQQLAQQQHVLWSVSHTEE